MNRRLFYRALANSASLRRLLQSALIHPQSNPDRLDERGEELDGDALALASTGETAVFRRELVRPVAKRSSRSFSTLRVPWKARRSRLPRSPASASLRRSVR